MGRQLLDICCGLLYCVVRDKKIQATWISFMLSELFDSFTFVSKWQLPFGAFFMDPNIPWDPEARFI